MKKENQHTSAQLKYTMLLYAHMHPVTLAAKGVQQSFL